jgi:hypothetical protein
MDRSFRADFATIPVSNQIVPSYENLQPGGDCRIQIVRCSPESEYLGESYSTTLGKVTEAMEDPEYNRKLITWLKRVPLCGWKPSKVIAT